jgi:hypothetical protein
VRTRKIGVYEEDYVQLSTIKTGLIKSDQKVPRFPDVISMLLKYWNDQHTLETKDNR